MIVVRVRVLAAAAAVGALALPTLGPAAVSAAPAPNGVLFVEGDSLTVGSSSAIKANLRSEFRRITVDAQVGRNTPTGVSRLGAGRDASVWVVALGTNDSPSPWTMKRHVNTVLKRAGDKPVLWVSVWRSPAYGKVNRMLTRLDRSSGQLSVLRWDQFIKAHPRLLAGDGIHLTPAGYQVRGKMIADAVRALLSER
jgi:lysophospholipase L1-like esterase